MTTTTLTKPAPQAPPAEIRRDDARPRPEPPALKRRAQPDAPSLPKWVARWKFDVHQYHAMAKAGVLNEDDRVELIDGEIAAMSSIGPEHVGAVNSSAEFWILALAGKATVQIQGSVRLDEWNEPQPDVAILKRRDDFYRSGLAGPDDVLLLIEVSDTSLRYDRRIKLALYARFGIPEFWIANIRARSIEVYTDPVNGEYTSLQTFRRGQTITPTAFPDVVLPVSDIIGGLA